MKRPRARVTLRQSAAAIAIIAVATSIWSECRRFECLSMISYHETSERFCELLGSTSLWSERVIVPIPDREGAGRHAAERRAWERAAAHPWVSLPESSMDHW